MKIYAVTGDYFSSVASLFSSLGDVRILPTNYENLDADLIIFSGGEDINPSRYTGKIVKSKMYNERRDEFEFKVFNDIVKKRLPVKKVLGFCRGLQLINVGLGGSLYEDIETSFGKRHESVHGVEKVSKNNLLGFFTNVNSMHHQAIRNLGDYISPTVLLRHSEDCLLEAVLWGGYILGTQFHPEFFPHDLPERSKFISVIESWITKKTSPEKIELKKEWDVAQFPFQDETVNFPTTPPLLRNQRDPNTRARRIFTQSGEEVLISRTGENNNE